MSSPHPLESHPIRVQQQAPSCVQAFSERGENIAQRGDGQVNKKYPIRSNRYACAKDYLRNIQSLRVQFQSH
jgi:hypothetical protein